jgi:hypothetical protein
MITQTPEYVITANNRRIVYVNTFICLSLVFLSHSLMFRPGLVIFFLAPSVRSIAPRVVSSLLYLFDSFGPMLHGTHVAEERKCIESTYDDDEGEAPFPFACCPHCHVVTCMRAQ